MFDPPEEMHERFEAALATLVTGNTVVLKSSEETLWSGRLLADCLRDVDFPPGVFHFLTGGVEIGEAIVGHPDLAGLTFTGSQEVGMRIYRRLAAGLYPRPCVAEMGGKNARLVTGRADLERAATGIVRSAFGRSGQKASAVSRLYVGAWPGYQAFGGWKDSGSTGKAIGSFYYLPPDPREQSQTWVE